MAGNLSYSLPAKWLHWLVAALVFILLPMGLIMTRLDEGALQDRLFVLHESFGVTLFGLMGLRVANRLISPPPPSPLASVTERRLAAALHRTLYVLLLVVPLLGLFALAAYGLGPSFFWVAQFPAIIAKNEELSKTLFELHLIGALLVGALAAIHIGAALWHHRRGDWILARMSLFR
jgi:cytochrome b561